MFWPSSGHSQGIAVRVKSCSPCLRDAMSMPFCDAQLPKSSMWWSHPFSLEPASVLQLASVATTISKSHTERATPRNPSSALLRVVLLRRLSLPGKCDGQFDFQQDVKSCLTSKDDQQPSSFACIGMLTRRQHVIQEAF